MLLADLSASGVPVDTVSIAAAVVSGGVASGHIEMQVVHKELGMDVRPFERPGSDRALWTCFAIETARNSLTTHSGKRSSTRHGKLLASLPQMTNNCNSLGIGSLDSNNLKESGGGSPSRATGEVQVCVVVHEMGRVRAAPLAVDVYDEQGATAVREMCLALCDVRAILVEVVCQLDLLQNSTGLPIAKRQVLALQVLAFLSPTPACCCCLEAL